MTAEHKVLADLVTFARHMVEGNDIEPWAAVIGVMRSQGKLDDEQALWTVKLYNAFDDLGSAFKLMERWPTAEAWAADGGDHAAAKVLPCSRERRNLRGGKVTIHLDSYAAHLGGQTQMQWLREAIPGSDPQANFNIVMPYMRRLWGVGRQTAFEWAEFVAKVLDLPIDTPDAYLWESSGPRQSIERLYDNDRPTLGWLNARANDCRDMLAAEGVALSWWDFETVICDFNVARKGRYYPGQHLAMIREEIEGLPEPHRERLREAFAAVVPEPWRHVPPGVDKELQRHYRDTGTVRTPFDWRG